MAKLTIHVQRTRLKTSSTDKHYSLDSEDDFRSGFRNVTVTVTVIVIVIVFIIIIIIINATDKLKCPALIISWQKYHSCVAYNHFEMHW